MKWKDLNYIFDLKHYNILVMLLMINVSSKAFSQSAVSDTLKLSKQQYEAIFIKQNLLLLAEKYKISQAEALVLQAKLWPNPNLSLEDVNLWTTDKQLSYLDEPLPNLFGNSFKNTQFSVQLEQLIITAGKRRKKINLEKLGVKVAEEEFKELLRDLKYEFRSTLTEIQYLQLYTKVFSKQLDLVKNLLNGYKRQLENEHISKGDYMRLQTLQLQLSKELHELSKEKNENEKDLKLLLSLTGPLHLHVLEDDFTPDLEKIHKIIFLEDRTEILTNRPDVKLADLEKQHYESLLILEKSQIIPDVEISASYDRGGGIWPSFFGFGITMDLPIFDGNQGHVKHAEWGVENKNKSLEAVHLRADAEFERKYKDFQDALSFYESIDAEFEKDLDDIFESYTRNFVNRNISMLHYLDFQEAYLENKQIILEAKKEIHLQLEALQYTIGKEL